MALRIAVLALVAVVFQLACQAPPDADVIADYRGGRVLAGELDATIVEMPASRRAPLNDADIETWQALVREIAMNRLLAARAELDGVAEEPRFLKRAEDEQKRDTVNLCLERIAGRSAPPDGSEVERFLAENPGRFDQPERRLVSQIFLPLDSTTSMGELRSRADQLRRRYLDGESFESLAREYSGSETGLRGGLVGWFERPAEHNDLSRVIFGLEPGVLSEPVVSSSGVHIFLVSSARGGLTLSDEEKRDKAMIVLAQRQSDARAREFLENWEDPPDSFGVDQRELAEIVNFGAGDTEIFRIGDAAMTVERFHDYLRETAKKIETSIEPEFAGSVYQTLVLRERLFQHCLATGTVGRGEIEERFEPRRRRLLASLQRDSELRALAMENREALRSFFDRRWRRFADEVELDLHLLTVTIGDEPMKQQADLRLLGDDLVSGRTDFDGVAARSGYRANHLGWQPFSRIVAAYPKLDVLLGSVGPGEATPPIVIGNELMIAVVAGRRDPERPVFDDVATEVADAYVIEHRKDLYAELERRWLAEAHFRIHDKALSAAIAATRSGKGPPLQQNHE